MKDSFGLTLTCWRHEGERVEVDEQGVVMAVYHANKVSRKFQREGSAVGQRLTFSFPTTQAGKGVYLLNKSSRGIPSAALVLGGAWFEPWGGQRDGLLLCSSAIWSAGEKKPIHRRRGRD